MMRSHRPASILSLHYYSHCPRPPPGRRQLVTRLGALLAAAGLAIGGAGPGCSESCDGVEVDGVCQTVCQDELCPTNWYCVNNACRAQCDTSSDCTPGQKCEALVTDYNARAKVCTGGDSKRGGRTGAACTEDDDCDGSFGYACFDGECGPTCQVHPECGSTGACTGERTTDSGAKVRVCKADDYPRGAGQYGTPCPQGDECDTESGFQCVSSGPGDIDAYCTRRDCDGDGDCPTGFFCSVQQTAEDPCGDVCDFDGDDAPGCIEDSEIGPGRPYSCGTLNLQFNICLVRSFCNECETDADCASKPNQLCARDRSGSKICTIRCDPGVNSCPWGDAAGCGLWDEELGFETCAHRFGQCTGTGASCEPCIDQSDCPGGLCQTSSFTGERYCIDFGVSCSCDDGTSLTCVGGGCPLTPEPAHLRMACFGGSRFENTPRYNRCIGAVPTAAAVGEPEGCWPPL